MLFWQKLLSLLTGSLFNGGAGEDVNAYNSMTGVGSKTQQGFAHDERLETQSYNSAEAQLARDFTHEENSLARDWQERMSNTAIQRQVADAREAGINPYYLFGAGSAQGAGVPQASGSSATQAASSQGSPGSGNSAAFVASAMAQVVSIFGKIMTKGKA